MTRLTNLNVEVVVVATRATETTNISRLTANLNVIEHNLCRVFQFLIEFRGISRQLLLFLVVVLLYTKLRGRESK